MLEVESESIFNDLKFILYYIIIFAAFTNVLKVDVSNAELDLKLKAASW